jgi:acetolactate synthase-1/2/3 large subunit
MEPTESRSDHRTVAAVLAEGLSRAGVRIAFTVPGESVVSLLDALAANNVRIVATRHESSAAFMAEAVGQLTSRPAVCVATRGPGAANLAIGLLAARADSAPLIAIVGGVTSAVRGREAFQELDVVRTFEPVVKWAGEIRNAAEAIPMLERAVSSATSDRPGPVVLAVAADVFDALVSEEGAASTASFRLNHSPDPDPLLVRKVLHLIGDARRPLILAGAGILRARSTDALVRFAEALRVPVVASWRRGDVFPNDNHLYLGMTGLGAPASVRARIEEADALLVLGSRLDEMTTFGYSVPAETTRWAQVDMEPLGPNAARRPDIAIGGDVAAFLRVAQRLLSGAAFDAATMDERTVQNAADRATFEASAVVEGQPWSGPGVHPGNVVAALGRLLPREAIVTTDAGDFGTWAARGFRFHRPGTLLGSSAGPMGYGLPAAIGAALARPGRLGVALAGDGGFGMTMAELETAVRERAHVLAVVFDNSRYGTIWRHQEDIGQAAGLGTRLGAVDFAAIAEACGALGIHVASDAEFEPALVRALEAGRPAVLHLALDARWTTPDAMSDAVPETAPETAPEATPDTTAEADSGTGEDVPALEDQAGAAFVETALQPDRIDVRVE